jgi:hypothetical protein
MKTLPSGSVPIKSLSWRWHGVPICPCEICPSGLPGRLEIDGVLYVVTCNATLPERGEPVVYGWRLENTVNGNVYDIDCTQPLMTCDCPGFVRWSYCKHCRVLPRALAGLRGE